MVITHTKLTRAAGVCAVAAGLLFVFVQFIHPTETVANVTTTTWTLTHVLSLTMAVLAVWGITGMYLRQVRETGLLGLIGFVLFSLGFFVVMVLLFVEAAVLPTLADAAPQYVKDVLAIVTGDDVIGDVGGLAIANVASAVGFLLGGLLFGIALFRARVLFRWASLLLAIGAVGTLLVAVLPHSLDRLAAFPIGVALAGLGVSLWRSPSSTGEPPRVLNDARSDAARA
jgi:hypothetical protein